MTWQELIDNKALRHQAFLWEENGHTTAYYLLTEITEKNGMITIVGRSSKQNERVTPEASILTKTSITKEFSVNKESSQPRVDGHKIIITIPNFGVATFSTKNI